MTIFNRMKKTMIKNDNFSMIFEGFASKEKIKQNVGNHQKIIKNHQKIIVWLGKTMQIHDFGKFSWVFFKQNDNFLMIF